MEKQQLYIFIEGGYVYNINYLFYLVVVDELLQFICMDNNVESTHLGETELLPIDTSETHLEETKK